MTLTPRIFSTVRSADIFRDADEKTLREVLSEDGFTVCEYKKGDTIYSVESFNLAVGIFIRGSAKVIKDSGVVISTLKEKDIFGCASLFASRDYYVNNIVALKDCKVLFISKATTEKLMLRDPSFALSFIRYLSDRLYYLNTRIVSFTGGTAESRLANYLYGYFRRTESDEVTVSMSQLAFSIDIARASLYRALDSLCERGAIEKEGKTIRLINEKELQNLLSQ